jgi:uncharacterized RDD family membrane protein YckC
MGSMVPLAPLDTDVAIETPEHVVFRYRLAGPARRFFAYLIDLTVCTAALVAALVVIAVASAGTSAFETEKSSMLGFGIGVWLVLVFATQWVYFALLEAIWGVTIGKRALGLRVVTTEGRPIGARAAALRNVLRAADSLPVTLGAGVGAMFLGGLGSVVGATSMALTSRFQRLGDLVAGTMVIVPERATVGAPIVLTPPLRADERDALPSHVDLDADERVALEMFLRRRVRLGRARENELAEMIVEPLVRRFGFRAADPARTLAVLYDRAANEGRDEAPQSHRGPTSWR